jgi:metal-responsive CopG/Arc/MetJ family transcriptional regulator
MGEMRIGVSLPEHLVAFADEESKRRGMSRSGLLAHLLHTEQIREQIRRYLDRHGWDIAEEEEAWRSYQQRRMAEEYTDDEW